MKKVLITGGTGSLGKALLKRAHQENWDTQFTIFSRNETQQGLLKSIYPQHRYVLGDVSKENDLERAMYDIDTIFHFAAYKVVPTSQVNVTATIDTNVKGSENVARVATRFGVERVVATSTDKSCEPVSYYGTSKMAMEGIFQEANSWGNTKFTLARYGNVVCSNASVIPLFIRQQRAGGPLTVTDFNMTRFWISLDDAVDLVLLALEQKPGTITVPKAGAMSMGDLAVSMAKGLVVKEIGVRPGEKKHEKMVHASESLHTEEFDDHFIIHPATTPVMHDEPFVYTSDNPKTWLTFEQLKAMITAAGFEL
jgi:UDP-N-acetylglucosamine 4,6-dehydratase